MIEHLKAAHISATFHYVPLHTSPMGMQYGGHIGMCPVTEDRAERLVRLPFFADLTASQQDRVIERVLSYQLRG